MTIIIHEFDGREGGMFRVSLTYDSQAETGKTTPNMDSYHGRFVKLIPNEQVIEVVEFETTDPLLQGEMTISFTLTDKEAERRYSRFTIIFHPVYLLKTMRPAGVCL